jgi:dipeptide/tripeptide permease
VHLYGDVFFMLGKVIIIVALACFLLVPILKKWMHDEANPRAGH